MEDSLLDYINIKTYPELIINELKKNEKSKIRNLRSFYGKLLDSLSLDIKNSYLNRILKYLSYKEPATILILDDIKNNIYQKELIAFFKEIANEITNNNFYDEIKNHCTFIYFDNSELDALNNNFNNKETYLYLLFVHACNNYKTNTPSILAERLLQDSFNLYDINPSKAVFLKTAADLNNPTACLLYGNMMYDDIDIKFNYYLKGKSIPGCIWEIAYLAENYSLSDKKLQIVKKECKDIIAEGEKYLDKSIVPLKAHTDLEIDSIMTALKMMLYLANVKHSSKGYCSVGKYFIDNTIAFVDYEGKVDKSMSLEEGINYSLKSVRLGNIHAMQNLGGYYYENKDDEYKAEVLLHISADAKDLFACQKFAKILLEKNKVEASVKYFKDSSDNDGESPFQLARIYENENKNDEAIKYYEKSIELKYYKSVINLAELYFKIYMNNNNNGYLLLAINTIEKYYDQLNAKDKKDADFLLKNMKSIN